MWAGRSGALVLGRVWTDVLGRRVGATGMPDQIIVLFVGRMRVGHVVRRRSAYARLAGHFFRVGSARNAFSDLRLLPDQVLRRVRHSPLAPSRLKFTAGPHRAVSIRILFSVF